MKKKPNRLSKNYLAALREYLREGSRSNLKAALELGHRAVILQIETLELARIHEAAFVALDLPNAKIGMINRAQSFFTEAIVPIVETHKAARESKATLNRLNEMLGHCTHELAATHLQLKRGIIRRKNVEAVLKKSGEDYAVLLKDSLELQAGFRQLTRQVLAAQEDERKKISRELQDEIAQTLLGINARLHSLRHESRNNSKGLRKEIASTRQLVVKSAKSVRLAASRLGSL